MWQQNSAYTKPSYTSQVQWTHTDMFPAPGTTPSTVVTTQGPLPSGYTPFTVSFTDHIKSITICYSIASTSPTQFTWDIWFLQTDNTTLKVRNIASCQNGTFVLTPNPLTGAVRGFHFHTLENYSNLTESGKKVADPRYWSAWMNSDPCSLTKMSLTATSMTIMIDGASTATQDLSSQKSNTYAAAQGDPSLCTTNYVFAAFNSPAFAWLTVSATGLITVGPSTDPAIIGTHTVNVVMDLQPYARALATFTVTITCVFHPPQSAATTYYFYVGVTQPASILTFTQTTASQTCGLVATMSVTPAATWLSLTSNTSAGGTLTLNGCTSSNIGTYTVKLTNTSLGVVKELSVTLIVEILTCKIAVFETSPSPFSDIVVNMPTTSYNVQFKVYTDIERLYSMVCPIIATFTTSYAAVNVSTPYSNISVSPGSITVPSAYGTHPVQVEIKSSAYDQANVQRVQFNFNVIVQCTITSFTISTTETDFNFELESGTPTPKGPYIPVQTPNCQYPVTYYVDWYIDDVQQMSDANSQFDFAQTKYTAITNYSDPLFVGKVIKYNLVYQITDVFGTTHNAEKALLMRINPNCKVSVLQDRLWNMLIIKVPAPGHPQSSLIDASLSDTTAQFYSLPTKCGERLLSAWSPPLPSYVSYDGVLQQLSTSATAATLADVGAPQTYSVRCDLKDFIGFATGFTKFDVVIQVICEVFEILWVTIPPAVIEVFPGVTSQPVLVPFASTALPACVNTVYTVASPPSFVSLNSITQTPTTGGNVKVDGALASDQNDYPLVLTATTGAQVSTQSFIVRITDPCSKQVFDSSTLSDMTIIRNFDPAIIQTFSVSYSTIGSNPPIVCPFQCSITNPAGGRPFIIQDAVDQFKITADPALTTSSDVGDNLSDMTCVSVNFPSLVAPKAFQFKTIVSECVANISLPAIASQTYKFNTGIKQLTLSPATLDKACTYATTYSVSSPLSLPSWITWDADLQKFTFNPTIPAHVGSISITVEVSIPDPATSPAATMTASQTFTVVVQNDCDLTYLIDKVISDMTVKVSAGVFDFSATQDVTFLNERSEFYGDSTYCGDRLFTFSPSLPTSYLAIDSVGGGTTLTLRTTNAADAGDHPVTFTVTLASYSGIVTALTKSFTCHVICEVFSIDIVQNLPQISTFLIDKDPPLFLPFQLNVSPNCGLNFAISPMHDFVFYDVTTGQVEVTSKNNLDVGTYDLKLIASPPQLGVSTELPFNLVMTSRCTKANIIPQKIPSIFALKQDPAYKAQHSFEFQDFTYDVWIQFQSDCGPVDYQLVMNGSTKPVPNHVTLIEKKIDVDFSKMPAPGSVNLGLIVQLRHFPDRKITIPFVVELGSSELRCFKTPDQSYKFGDPPLNFGIMYQNTTITTGIPLNAVKTPIALDTRNQEIQLPAFVNYDSKLGVFTVSEVSYTDFKNYRIGLKIGYLEYPTISLTCSTQLTIGYTPDFIEIGKLRVPEIKCGVPWSTIIPEFKDVFGFLASAEIDFGKLDKFLLYISATRNITTAENIQDIPPGSYEININLKDSLGAQMQKSFKVKVVCFSFWSDAQAASEKYTVRPINKVQQNPPKPFIKSINNVGKVRVGFTQKLVIPTFTKYPEFKEDKNRMKQNCTASYANPDQCYTRLLLQQSIQEQTKEAVEIVNRGLVFDEEKGNFQPIIELTMEPGYYSNKADLDFIWNCTDFQPLYMDFQIDYNYYMNVSIHDFKDSLKVQFNGYWYFQSAENNEIIEESVAIIEKSVPAQLDPKGSGNLQQAANTVQAASKSVVIANFVINLFLGGALQQLFSAIRKLTIMVHLLIINVKIPANAQLFFAALLGFVSFDIIELGPYIRAGLKLPEETDLINDNFGYLGYTSSYFVINMGSLLIPMVYFITMLLFYAGTKCVKNEKFNWVRNWLTKDLLWNSILSFIIESYMIVCISSLTNFKKFQFNSVGTVVSSNLAIIGLIILIGYPLWSLVFMRKKANLLQTPSMKQKYGVVYEGLYLKRGRKDPMTEPLVNLYRMLLLTFVLIYLQQYRYFQLFFVNLSVTFLVIYVGICEPYIEKQTLNFQFFNESFISITNYHLMCFADFILDEQTRIYMGWSMIICVCFNLVINISSIMFNVATDTYKKLKKKWLLYKYNKAKRGAEERQAAKKKQMEEDNAKNANSLRELVQAKFKAHFDSERSNSFDNSFTDNRILCNEIEASFTKPSKQYLTLHAMLEKAKPLPALPEESERSGSSEKSEEKKVAKSEQLPQLQMNNSKSNMTEINLQNDKNFSHGLTKSRQPQGITDDPKYKNTVTEQQFKVFNQSRNGLQMLNEKAKNEEVKVEKILPRTIKRANKISIPEYMKAFYEEANKTPQPITTQRSQKQEEEKKQSQQLMRDQLLLFATNKNNHESIFMNNPRTYQQQSYSDDALEHEIRVQRRQREINLQIQTPSAMQRLQDHLWSLQMKKENK